MQLTLAILALLSASIEGAAVNTLPTVTIASGVLIGTTSTVNTPTAGTAAVTQFFGVPFASSAPERFAPPQPPEKWDTPLTAQSRKPVCVQQFESALNSFGRLESLFNDPLYPPPEESEDCLYANIFVPPGTGPSDKKAVLFWIFGGNLAFGGGSLHFYDGSSFAYNQDVIVVTHSYRTNLFGFPGSSQIGSEDQNVGFQDQRFALQWVKDNIAHFGGDPTRITLFGESAGGYSVRTLIGLPPDPLPFHAAILESEAAISTQVSIPVGSTDLTSSWQALAIAVGCIDESSQLACMRSRPAAQLKNVSQLANLAFFPIEDGSTYVADIRPAMEAGTAAKVPIIIGTTKDEGRFLPYIEGLDNKTPGLESVLGTLFPSSPALVDTLVALAGLQPVTQAVSSIATDAIFLCPSSQLASSAQSNGYQVWRYLFSPSFPNQEYFEDAGAFHTSEIQSVFGTYFLSNELGNVTPQQEAISKYMQTAWANFAKDPTQGPGQSWPELGPGGIVNNIGANGNYGGENITAASIEPSLCAVLDTFLGQHPL